MSHVVIIGQGYVGLPLAQGAALAGMKVVGLDLNAARVQQLNAGASPVDDISDADIKEMLAAGYTASSDPATLAAADVIVICVPTPLDRAKAPDLRLVDSAVRSIATHAKNGALVVLESTTYPGTTESMVKPILEAAGHQIGDTLFLAFSPERIDPGNKTYGLRNTPKVVGADDTESLRLAVDFYEAFIEQVVPVGGTAEAELTKLLENTYRHVNIALVNELSVYAKELGIDIWEVIRAAGTKPFGFQAFYPGPGVGGHCIPIDPNYLGYRVKESLQRPFRFIELAEEINSSMPSYVVQRAQDILNDVQKSMNGSTILLLGVTYKSGISDTRESPAVPLAQKLAAKGAQIRYFDPFVSEWALGDSLIKREADLELAASEADMVILLQSHPGYNLPRLAALAKTFFDTRGATNTEDAIRL